MLSRNGRPPFAYEQGPKDVVYHGKDQTVRVVARFGPHRGRYVMHCHNLVHEDNDMMVQLRWARAASTRSTPIRRACCRRPSCRGVGGQVLHVRPVRLGGR